MYSKEYCSFLMAGVVSVIGKGLLAGALGDLYLFIKSSAFHTQLENVLTELDIKAEFDIVQALLEDIGAQNNCKAVLVASEQVKESINDIHRELRGIQKELEIHKTRYFNTIRTPNYQKYIKNLCKCKETLCKRRELLISVLGIKTQLKTVGSCPSTAVSRNTTPPVPTSLFDKIF